MALPLRQHIVKTTYLFVRGYLLIDLIHRDAEKTSSRKPLFSLAQPYALGPGICALLPRPSAPGAVTLIHPRSFREDLFSAIRE